MEQKAAKNQEVSRSAEGVGVWGTTERKDTLTPKAGDIRLKSSRTQGEALRSFEAR